MMTMRKWLPQRDIEGRPVSPDALIARSHKRKRQCQIRLLTSVTAAGGAELSAHDGSIAQDFSAANA
jgi:hypothetical protein